MVTSIPPCEAWRGRENHKSWSTSRKAPVAVWQQPQTPRDHAWNFWASQRQSLCHTKPGSAHAKLRTPALHLSSQHTCGFVRWEKALKSLLLVQLSREICLLGTSMYPPAQQKQAQHKQKNNNNKRAFKLVCTKTFQKKLLSWRV